MGIRKKWIDKTALLCMLAFTLTACKGKEAEPSQSTGGDVVQQSSESLTVSEEGSSEEGTMEENGTSKNVTEEQKKEIIQN